MSQTGDGTSALLDRGGYAALAAALGDSPLTCQTIHLLQRQTCRVYLAGDPARFAGAIIQPDMMPEEPTAYGSDPRVLWHLVQQMRGWTCIDVPYACATALGALMAQQMGVPVRYLDDIYFTLTRAAATHVHPQVRLLTPQDLPLLQAAPEDLRSSLFSSPIQLLTEGIVACAVISSQIVATALTAAVSDRYADVGVYTQDGFRGQGLATAATSLVARQVQARGLIPLWSAGAHNSASLRVAQKVGFAEVTRRRYVIPQTVRQGGSR